MPHILELIRRPEAKRAIRYGTVGGAVNASLYCFYLILTLWVGMVPLIATSAVYATGVFLTYLGNSIWAFEKTRSHKFSAPRYIAVYLIGYLFQTSLLYILTKVLSAPHQIAQLFAMGCAAGSIFLLLNFWVFADRRQH